MVIKRKTPVKKKAVAKKKPKQPKTKARGAAKIPPKKRATRAGTRRATVPRDQAPNAIGRPPIQISEDDIKIAVMLARRGCTMFEIAQALKVSLNYCRYQLFGEKSFMNALKESMTLWDTKIEQALSDRAHGYSHPEEKIFYDAKKGRVVRVETVKHYPPDPTSMIFWLKNRQPDTWRDKREIEPVLPPGRRVIISYEGEDADDGDAGEEV